MISRAVKIQLLVFAIITVLGGAFVGGRYAQIDRLLIDRTYTVTAQFTDSGGIFDGAQVTYRGIPVGRVGELEFDNGGVKATLDIEDDAPRIPADVMAIVANKSAIGEQFIDLQPRDNEAPYLAEGSAITLGNTRIPIDTTTLLVDVNNFVRSVDTESLRTVVSELGQAFEGTGPDLATILETSTEFINEADENFEVTRQLIRNSSSVLQTQIDKRGELSRFSDNLALLSDTLVEADPDIRRLFDDGSEGARTVREVVDENSEDLGTAVNDLVTANQPLSDKVVGLQAIFILYPYLLQGGFTVAAPVDPGNPDTDYNATFGLVLTPTPATCTYAQSGKGASGYRERRAAEDLRNVEFDTDVDCKVEDNKIARQPTQGKTVINRTAAGSFSGSGAPAGAATTGKDTLQWLLLDPANQ